MADFDYSRVKDVDFFVKKEWTRIRIIGFMLPFRRRKTGRAVLYIL